MRLVPLLPKRNAARRAAAFLLAAAMVVGAAARQPDKSDHKKKKNEKHQYALLFGTVFDARGLSVRGVEVRVRQKEGRKRWQAVTNNQGEFAVQLPVGTATYLVEVSPAGFRSDSKEVSFSGDERQDIVLRVSRRNEQ